MRRTPHYEEDNTAFPADAYHVQGYEGIAWHVLGWETETVYEEYETECPDCEEGEMDGETCPACGGGGLVWTQDDEPTERRTGRVVAIMVGDGRRFTLDLDDLMPISREAYCGECGQIGCAHDGLDREEVTEGGN